MRHCGLILFLALFLAGCSGNTRNGDALSAHQTAEKVKDSWSKMSKPIEIEVTGRTKDELEAIGSLAVWLDGMEGGKAVEFRFDGKVFKPTVPVLADSTVLPLVCYPFLPSLHPADTVAVSHPLGERLAGQIQSVTQTNDKTKITMKLEELTALLRLILKSDNISDVMQILEIQGDCVSTAAFLIPLKGEHAAFAVAHANALVIYLEIAHGDNRTVEIQREIPVNIAVTFVGRQEPHLHASVTQLVLHLAYLHKEVLPFLHVEGIQLPFLRFLRNDETGACIGIGTAFKIGKIGS